MESAPWTPGRDLPTAGTTCASIEADATRKAQVKALLAWLAMSFAAAGVGAIASQDAGTFYAQLARPAWAPPGWLFAPVWTVLYALMGIAAWLVWQERAYPALVLFVLQLALNALWTWLFFAWRLGAAAFVEILLLWLLIVVTMVAFWRARRLAGLLLLPYLLWVTYAAALTYAVWRANPGLLGTS
jgi:translocator protein